MPNEVCENCGKPFRIISKGQKCCSSACAAEKRRKYHFDVKELAELFQSGLSVATIAKQKGIAIWSLQRFFNNEVYKYIGEHHGQE